MYHTAPKSQLNLPHSPALPPPVTAKRQVVKFEEIAGYGGGKIIERLTAEYRKTSYYFIHKLERIIK